MTAESHTPLETARKLAELEILWWQGHNEKDDAKVIDAVAAQYELLFGLHREHALEAAREKLLAGMEHDVAEKAMAILSYTFAEKHWELAREHMARHFRIILANRKGV